MESPIVKAFFGLLSLALLLIVIGVAQGRAQEGTSAVLGNGAQPSPPGAVSGEAAKAPAETGSAAHPPSTATSNSLTHSASNDTDDNPYDPVLEPPPLPKGKPTLIGGIATSVDQVRYRMTIAPFGGGAKVKLFLDERSHIFRDGTEATVLAIHKGDRVYADTMLDGSRVFAKNVRVVTESGIAEVRGQVVAAENGTIRVRDQLSFRPVSFRVNGATKYSSFKGTANSADVQPGALIDVQFSADRSNHDVAQEIIVLAKPGEDYIFSGVVTNLDMRSNMLALENRSDQETYELHFDPARVEDVRKLKVGVEVTAHAVFDGKQYQTANLRIEKTESNESEGQAKVE